MSCKIWHVSLGRIFFLVHESSLAYSRLLYNCHLVSSFYSEQADVDKGRPVFFGLNLE